MTVNGINYEIAYCGKQSAMIVADNDGVVAALPVAFEHHFDMVRRLEAAGMTRSHTVTLDFDLKGQVHARDDEDGERFLKGLENLRTEVGEAYGS